MIGGAAQLAQGRTRPRTRRAICGRCRPVSTPSAPLKPPSVRISALFSATMRYWRVPWAPSMAGSTGAIFCDASTAPLSMAKPSLAVSTSSVTWLMCVSPMLCTRSLASVSTGALSAREVAIALDGRDVDGAVAEQLAGSRVGQVGAYRHEHLGRDVCQRVHERARRGDVAAHHRDERRSGPQRAARFVLDDGAQAIDLPARRRTALRSRPT